LTLTTPIDLQLRGEKRGIETTSNATTVTREDITPETARAERETAVLAETVAETAAETDTTEDLDLPEETTTEEGLQEDQEIEMTTIATRSTIETAAEMLAEIDTLRIVSTDLAMTEEEMTEEVMTVEVMTEEVTTEEEEMTLAMAAGTAIAETDLEVLLTPEIDVTHPKTDSREELLKRIEATPRIEELLLKMPERREEASDLKANILRDALKDPTEVEKIDPFTMIKHLRDADHQLTELRLITLTRSPRKSLKRLKMDMLKMLRQTEGIFNQSTG
jgi:hypothetical protein